MVTQTDLVNHVGHNEICGKGEAVSREGRRLEGESGHCPFIHLVKLSKQFKLMKKKSCLNCNASPFGFRVPSM